MNNIKLFMQRNPSRMAVEFWLTQKSMDGHVAIGKPVQMVNLADDGAVFEPPTFMMDEESAQLFIDELWNSGFRPSKYKNDGSAQEKHLQDMRKIAFQFLDKVK